MYISVCVSFLSAHMAHTWHNIISTFDSGQQLRIKKLIRTQNTQPAQELLYFVTYASTHARAPKSQMSSLQISAGACTQLRCCRRQRVRASEHDAGSRRYLRVARALQACQAATNRMRHEYLARACAEITDVEPSNQRRRLHPAPLLPTPARESI